MEERQNELMAIIERQKRIEEKLDRLIIMEKLPAYYRVTFWKREILLEEEMKKSADELARRAR